MRQQTLSSTTACTSKGDLIGYKTTYTATTALIAEKAASSKAAADARPMSCSGTERLRLAVSSLHLQFATAPKHTRAVQHMGVQAAMSPSILQYDGVLRLCVYRLCGAGYAQCRQAAI
jgi:hypothetical protein